MVKSGVLLVRWVVARLLASCNDQSAELFPYFTRFDGMKLLAKFSYLASICALLFGCGGQPSGDVLSTVPAAGVLTYKGKPLEFHQVIFMSEGKRPAAGASDSDGKFTLGTNEVGDGAPPGEYEVAVTYVGPPSTNPAEGMTEFTTPPPPKIKIDRKYADSAKSGLTVTVPSGGSSDLKIELN